MPSRSTQLVESFAYEGMLDWTSAVWIFIGVGEFIGWLLWRERKISGPATASFFVALRMVAVGLVLWMLLGPTHLSTKRTTIPQTVAIIVDSSQSMDVAEPMPKIEEVRWQQAIAGEPVNQL